MIIGWQCDNLRLRHLDRNSFVLLFLFCHHAQPLLLLLVQSILFRSTFFCAVGEWKYELFPQVAVCKYIWLQMCPAQCFASKEESFEGKKKVLKGGPYERNERMDDTKCLPLIDCLLCLSSAHEKSARCAWDL